MQRWHCHTEPLQPAKVSAGSIARRGVQGTSSMEPSPRAGRAGSSLCKPSCQIHEHPHSLCAATASHSWEREEKPLGVTALLGMPGGQIPPLTPTPGAVTSWLSSPMP